MKAVPARRWNLAAVILLWIALLTAVGRFIATGWTDGLWVAVTVTLFGFPLGLALGISRFRRGMLYLLTPLYSLFVIPWALGSSQYPGMLWQARLLNLSGRLSQSFALFFSRQDVEDTLLFTALAAVVYWFLSLHAGYALTRRFSFIGSVLPSGVILFLVQIYDSWSGERIGLLAFFIFICLLLLGQMNFAARREEWQRQRIWISSSANRDLTIILTVSAALLVLTAWLLPVSARSLAPVKNAWEQLTLPWKQARQDLANAIAGLDQGASSPTADYYHDNLPLGRSGATGDEVLFTIRSPLTVNVSRYYWIVRSYDRYTGGVWSSSPVSQRSLSARTPALISPEAAQWPAAEFAFTVPGFHLAILPTPARPVWIDRPAILEYLPISADLIDPQLIRLEESLQPGEVYLVHASVANPTRLQLRTAGSAYPEWVTSRYLQLPADFPAEIASLAAEITAAEPTPYDQAVALTNYLRTTIHYNQKVIPAPEGYDPLAWFLFTTQEGFCNYYASAEVLMLRSVGIPARLAVGYAQGERVGANQFVVRSRNAHAWPEIYFPGIGWVEFEPTSSEQPLLRPSGEVLTLPGGENGSPREPIETADLPAETVPPILPGDEGSPAGAGSNSLLRITLYTLAALAIAVAVLLLFGIGEKRRRQWYRLVQTPAPLLASQALTALALPVPSWLKRWAHWSGLDGISRAFTVVHRSLRRLGAASDPARTPAQAAALLERLLPAQAPQINSLLHEYQQAAFSPHGGDLQTARAASALLRKAARRAILRQRVHALQVTIRKRSWRR